MARSQASIRGLKLDKRGIKEVLTSNEVESMMMDLGEEIVRDAQTFAGRGGYRAELWHERKTRSVVNIMDEDENAMRYEAKFGHLARAAGKNRGEA